MSTVERASEGSDGSSKLRGLIQTVRDSVLLRTAVAGLALIFVGYVIQDGVWAAILAAWGAALVLLGASAYGTIWWKRR